MRSITVERLIELLEGEDPEALVIFTADYGDHHHTQQALPLRGEIERVVVVQSGYSNSGYAVVEDEDAAYDDPGSDAPETYLCIR